MTKVDPSGSRGVGADDGRARSDCGRSEFFQAIQIHHRAVGQDQRRVCPKPGQDSGQAPYRLAVSAALGFAAGVSETVFVTRAIPEAGLAALDAAGLSYSVGQPNGELPVAADVLRHGAQRSPVLLSLLTEPITAELLADCPELLGVANMAVGYDNIDVGAATRLGIPVANTPGVLTETTADLTFALLLAVARRIPEADRYVRAGRFVTWGPTALLGGDVGRGPDAEQKTIGLIGYGRIAAAVARRALGFGMRVLACSRSQSLPNPDAPQPEWCSLDELLGQSDFVSVHVPGGPATHHMLGAAQLRRARSHAVLINTARGPVIDQQALIEVLESGHLGGVGLDVYEHEPKVPAALLAIDRVVVLPHIGSASLATRQAMATAAAANAVAFAKGQRGPNTINPGVYGSAAYRRRLSEMT